MTRRVPIPHQGSREVQALADVQRDTQRKRSDSPFGEGGRLVEGITIAATSEKKVSHGLRRRPRGWLALSLRSDASCEPPVETSRDVEQLVLHNYGAAEITFDAWVW